MGSRRMLKCPKCKQQTARLFYGHNEIGDYKQKYCQACGNEQPKVYWRYN